MGYFLGYKIRTTTTPQKRMIFNTYKENSSEAYRANVLTLNEILCENAKKKLNFRFSLQTNDLQSIKTPMGLF